MKTTILTAIYDQYDELKPVLDQSIDVDWVCVTDTPYHPYSGGWKIVHEPRPHLHPNRAAKLPKMLPMLYASTDTSIWIDASFRVTSRFFAEEALNYAQPIAQFRHPWRDCIYAEAEESLRLSKYAGEPIEEQMHGYHEYGHPKDWGLWATGVIARRHTPDVIRMGYQWLADVYEYSYQDQLSHPYACSANNLRPIDFPGTHLANDWLAYEGSGRH
jgi:hypothetical protein